MSKCNSETAEYHREWYAKHRNERKKQIADSQRRNHKRNREFVEDYLLTHPCIDCGESDIEVLQFDHVRGKKVGNLSNMVRKYQLDSVKLEITKCEVRCANCHIRITKKRRLAGSNGTALVL